MKKENPHSDGVATGAEPVSNFQHSNNTAEPARSQSISIQSNGHGHDDSKKANKGNRRGPPQANVLVELAQSAELFHSPDGVGYADVQVNGHRETWSIRSSGFRRWLARCYYEATQGAPNSEAVKTALAVIEAKAMFGSPERQVHLRVGELDGRFYLDLCDDAWRTVEIDPTGWRIIGSPPARFRRTYGMRPIPPPIRGGSIEILRSFLNVRSGNDFVLVISWVLACLRNHGPYPVLVLGGEQGSAKSTFSAMLRALLDPNAAPLRALSRDDRDLSIAANNGHVLAFDNVSWLSGWISDALCRLATGGGFAARQLFTDQDEVLFNATRPVILNGIEDIVSRPDLADRAIFIRLPPIPEERRQSERDLWASFDAARPTILGALLDAMVQGLIALPHTRLDTMPRMADFALFATACEGALWPTGTFLRAYGLNRDDAVRDVIEADSVSVAVRTLMARQETWRGTASDLLTELTHLANEGIERSRSWPSNGHMLSQRLKRTETVLRKLGIEIERKREGQDGARIIHIYKVDASQESPGSLPSVSSVPSVTSDGLELASTSLAPTVLGHTDDADGADAREAPKSGWDGEL